MQKRKNIIFNNNFSQLINIPQNIQNKLGIFFPTKWVKNFLHISQ